MSRSCRIAFALTSVLIVAAATGCEALYDYAEGHHGDQGSGAPPSKDPPPTAPPKGEACGPKICDVGTVCCNASCGICTPAAGGCTKQLCPPPPPPPPPPGACRTDGDCRAFSNYCDGCACDALAVGEKDPVCNGTIVQCLVDPCGGKQALCRAGKCVLASPPPPPPPPPPGTCRTDADCRAFSNYCDGCACDALAVGEKDPVCNGMIVQCLVDPCGGKQALCRAGKCVLASAPPPPPPPPPGTCRTDADCRAFSNYCDGCACDALAVGEKDPVCNGMIVQCLVDPCGGKQALCRAGKCVLASASPPECDQRTQGGPTSCKSPDLWKRYASDDCKMSGLALSEISLREDCGGGYTRFVDYTCCPP